MLPLPLMLAIGAVASNTTKWGELSARLQSFVEDGYRDLIRQWSAPKIKVEKHGESFRFILDLEEEIGKDISTGESKIAKFTYHVDLKLKVNLKDISLAEIDFSDWGDSNSSLFTVNVKKIDSLKKESIDIEFGSSDFSRVIEVLRSVPLFLGHDALYPDDTLERVNESWHTRFKAANQMLNNSQAIIDLIRHKLFGEERIVRDQLVEQRGIEHTHLLEEESVDRLIKVVIEKDKPELLSNYFKTIKFQIDNNLKYVEEGIARREARVEQAKKEKNEETAKNYKRIWISIFVSALFIGALVTAPIFFPAFTPVISGIGVALVGIFQVVVPALLRSPFATGIGFLSFLAIGIGIRRNLVAKKECLRKINEEKLEKAAELKGFLSDTQKKSENTLELVEDISRRAELADAETLDYSGRSLGNVGVKLISGHIKSGKFGGCRELILKNCDIGKKGVADLANALRVQTEDSKCSLEVLDLTGNGIEKEGLQDILFALKKNITLTEVFFDKNDDEPDEIKELKKKIEKQLNINRWLREEYFFEADGSQNREEKDFQSFARDKILSNFDITYVPFTVNQALPQLVEDVLKQNKIMHSVFRVGSIKDVPEVLEAFNLNPGRWIEFIEKIEKRDDFRGVFKDKIANNPELLREIGDKKDAKDLLRFLIGAEISEEQLSMLAGFADIFPNRNKILGLLGGAGYKNDSDVVDEFYSISIRTFKSVLDAKTAKEAKEKIEGYRSKIENSYSGAESSEFLQELDSVLNPNSRESDLVLVRMEEILKRNPKGRQSDRYDLRQFIELFVKYRKIMIEEGKDFESELPTIEQNHKERLKCLLLSDISKEGGFKELKQMDFESRQDLFSFLFRKGILGCHESKERQELKATLASGIIDQISCMESFNAGDLIGKLRGIFATKTTINLFGRPPILYADLNRALNDQLKRAYYRGDRRSIEALDIPLQRVAQKNIQKYKLLQESGSVEGFGQLKSKLQEGVLDLRRFDVKDGVDLDDDVKQYIDNITKRNQLLYLIENCNPVASTCNLFFEIYRELDPKFLNSPPLELSKVRGFINYDVYNEYKDTRCTRLKDLDKEQRFKLLKFCFQGEELGGSKAAFVSSLINKVFNETNQDVSFIDYLRSTIYRSFISPDSLDVLRNKLEEQRVELLSRGEYELVDLIEPSFQEALRVELIDKHQCLIKEPEDLKSDMVRLKEDLKGNFNLRMFDFGDYSVDKSVREFINYICNRNIISDINRMFKRDGFLYPKDVGAFLKAVNDIGVDGIDKAFSELSMTSEDVLNILKKDIGEHRRGLSGRRYCSEFSCEYLKGLQRKNPKLFIKFLAFSFRDSEKNQEDALVKANIIAKLMSIKDLSLEAGISQQFDVIDAIYWSIVPWSSGKTSNLATLRNNLQSIVRSNKSSNQNHIKQLVSSIEEALLGRGIASSLSNKDSLSSGYDYLDGITSLFEKDLPVASLDGSGKKILVEEMTDDEEFHDALEELVDDKSKREAPLPSNSGSSKQDGE